MSRLKQRKSYTVLVVPKGTGTTKTFDLMWDYKQLVGIGFMIISVMLAAIGLNFYKQNLVVRQYEQRLSQKEQQLRMLVTGKEELEQSIGELEMALEQTKTELRLLRPQKIVENAPIASAPIPVPEPEPEQVKGEGGADEDAMLEYIPTFKPCEGEITSPFGNRTNPFTQNANQMHKGIDVANSMGTPIYAAASGIVEVARYLNGYGYAIYIDHGNGIKTRYGHNAKLLVKEGQEVKKGDLIAKMGSTGNSTGPHLHFEILEDGKQVNPEQLFE